MVEVLKHRSLSWSLQKVWPLVEAGEGRGWAEGVPQVSCWADVFVFSCLVCFRHFTSSLPAIPKVLHHPTKKQ